MSSQMQQPVQQQNLSEIVHFDLIPNIRYKDVNYSLIFVWSILWSSCSFVCTVNGMDCYDYFIIDMSYVAGWKTVFYSFYHQEDP